MYAQIEKESQINNGKCMVFSLTSDICNTITESIQAKAKQKGIVLYDFIRDGYIISFTTNASNWDSLLDGNFINIKKKVYNYNGIKQYTISCELNSYDQLVKNMLKKNSWFISQNFFIFPWIEKNKLVINAGNKQNEVIEFVTGKKCNLRLIDDRSNITMSYNGREYKVSRPITDNIFSSVFIESDNIIIGILNPEALDFITKITKDKGVFCFELNEKILTIHQIKYSEVRKDICIMVCKDRDEAQKILLQIKNPISSMKHKDSIDQKQYWLLDLTSNDPLYILLLILCLLALAGFFFISKHKLKTAFCLLFFLIPHYFYLNFYNILLHILLNGSILCFVSLYKKNQAIIAYFGIIITSILLGFYFEGIYNYELFALSRVMLFSNFINLLITII
jgi:hypothetical protein